MFSDIAMDNRVVISNIFFIAERYKVLLIIVNVLPV